MSAGPIDVSQRARESYLSMNMLPEFDTADARAGRWDKTTGLQAFARFEAETRKDERERAVKEAEYYAKHSGVARNIAAAIRNLGEGD